MRGMEASLRSRCNLALSSFTCLAIPHNAATLRNAGSAKGAKAVAKASILWSMDGKVAMGIVTDTQVLISCVDFALGSPGAVQSGFCEQIDKFVPTELGGLGLRHGL